MPRLPPFREGAPDVLTPKTLTGAWILDLHLGPVALKLFSNELGEPRNGALPHL